MMKEQLQSHNMMTNFFFVLFCPQVLLQKNKCTLYESNSTMAQTRPKNSLVLILHKRVQKENAAWAVMTVKIIKCIRADGYMIQNHCSNTDMKNMDTFLQLLTLPTLFFF